MATLLSSIAVSNRGESPPTILEKYVSSVTRQGIYEMPNVRAENFFKTAVCGIAILFGMTCSGTIAKHETKTTANKSNEEMQQLSAGNRSTIAESFILVARDLDTYSLLRGTVPNLPDQAAEFFDSHTVVAVFLGQRPSGGYEIDVTIETDGKIRIKELKPPAGAMHKMTLSAPHKIVAIPTVRTTPLSLSFDETWQQRLRSYNIISGEAVVSKGAGTKRNFKLNGSIQMLRTGDLVTFVFDVNTLRLLDIASGKLDPANRLTLNRVDVFDFDGPSANLCSGVGEFANSERDLNLKFEPMRSTPDGPRTVASIKATSPPTKPN